LDLSNRILDDTITEEPSNAPDTADKIFYNIILFKPVIEEYAVYQGKLNKLYEEIENKALQKKKICTSKY
jgi:hypothetical protein